MQDLPAIETHIYLQTSDLEFNTVDIKGKAYEKQ